MDIVLSHHEEDLTSVRSKLERLQNHPFVAKRACVHVYTKSSSNSLSPIDVAGLNETVVVKTRNMGRESSSYLQYILSNYNNLPRHVAFLQADVEDIDNVLDKVAAEIKKEGLASSIHYKEQHLTSADLAALNSEQKAAVDFLVLQRSRGFVGLGSSTFSFYLREHRALEGIPRNSTVLVDSSKIGTDDLFASAGVVV
jgi:hypothetical protein